MVEKLRIIRQQPFQRLRMALDRAVQNKSDLAEGCELLLGPCDLLEQLASAAQLALNNDICAIKRMKCTILLAASDTFEIRNSLSDALERQGDTPLLARLPSEQGLIDFGALVVVALAAGRVGHRLGRAADYVEIVEAVAAASLPAQSFAHALDAGLDTKGLIALLTGLCRRDVRNLRLRLLAQAFVTEADSALFQCMRELLKVVRAQVTKVPTKATLANRGDKTKPTLEWDGATSEPIDKVVPTDTNILRIYLRDDDGDELLHQVEGVAFASPLHKPGVPNVATISEHGTSELKPPVIDINIPDQARAGWIGLQTEALRERMLEHREHLVTFWRDPGEPIRSYLLDARVPTQFLSAPRSMPAAPMYRSAATWGARIVDVSFEQEGPLEAKRDTHVTVTLSDQAKRVVVDIERPGSSQPISVGLELDNLTATGTIDAKFVDIPLKGRVRVYAHHDDNPDHELAFPDDSPAAVAPEDADDGLGPSGGDATPIKSPDDVSIERESIGVVIVRPGFLTKPRPAADINLSGASSAVAARDLTVEHCLYIKQVEYEVARQHLEVAKQKPPLDSKYVVEEKLLPWLDDAEVTFDGEVIDVEGPTAIALLQRLESMAALTVGGENLVWVAFLPDAEADDDDTGLLPFRISRSVAARALVLCPGSPDTLAQAIRMAADPADDDPATRPIIDRLRVMGTIGGGKLELTEPVRREERAAGAGAPYLTDFVAFGFRSDGSPGMRERLRTTSPTGSGAFAAMLPVENIIQSVQLKRQPVLFSVQLPAARATFKIVNLNVAGAVQPQSGRPRGGPFPSLHRPPGQPFVKIVRFEQSDAQITRIEWRRGHTRGVRLRIELELGNGDIWRRVCTAPEDGNYAELDLSRLGPGLQLDSLRVVASDGWKMATDVRNLEESAKGIVIRSAGGRRYWIDSARPIAEPVTWSILVESKSKPEDGPPVNWRRPAGAVLELDRRLLGRKLTAKVVWAGCEPQFAAPIVVQD